MIAKAATNAARYQNLDGLRGLMVLYVVMVHIEMYKPDYGFKGLPLPFLLQSGNVAVTMFFVMSGFIITTLLLKEAKRTGGISIKKFYLRRVCRIFPAYFMVLLAAVLLYASQINAKGMALSVFFLSNIAYLKFMLPPVLYPIWSIGVEEQFYAVHPFVMKRINDVKKILQLFLLVIAMVWLLRYLYYLPWFYGRHFYYALHNLFLYSRFDTILMGCIAAFYFSNTQGLKEPSWLYKKATQYLLLLSFVLLLLITAVYSFTSHELYGVVSALLMMNLSRPGTSVFNLQYRPLLFLGKISYGLYLTHVFVLYGVFPLLQKINLPEGFFQHLVIYIAALAATVSVAAISFFLIENRFLKLKERFA